MATDETRPADAGTDEHDPVKNSFEGLRAKEHEAQQDNAPSNDEPENTSPEGSDAGSDTLGKGYQPDAGAATGAKAGDPQALLALSVP